MCIRDSPSPWLGARASGRGRSRWAWGRSRARPPVQRAAIPNAADPGAVRARPRHSFRRAPRAL
eukprot:4664543-Pyramimonas_sp.AAC.1